MSTMRNHTKKQECVLPDAASGQRLLAALFSDDAGAATVAETISEYYIIGELDDFSSETTECIIVARRGTDRPCALMLARLHSTINPSPDQFREQLDQLQLAHLHFVPKILDCGYHESRAFIVTPMIEGLTLSDHCKNNSLTARQRVEYLILVARHVQKLHERAIMHSHISPNNILVDTHDEIFILGVGLPSTLDSIQFDTIEQAELPLVSLIFLAPEQAQGRSPTTRSDIYSLGAITYHTLTSRTPFPSTLPADQLIQRIASKPFSFSRNDESSIPKPVATIIAKAMKFSPSDRFGTASELANELTNWLNNEPVSTMRYQPWHKAWLWIKRRFIRPTTLNS